MQYVPGKQMQNVDGLSRKSYAQKDTGVIKNTSVEYWLHLLKKRSCFPNF